MAKVLGFCGSVRRGSWNEKLLQVVAGAVRGAGAEVTLVNLGAFDMPMFDEDTERAGGLPNGVVRFRQLLKSHQAFLIASPEYNSSFSPLLKNAIDWASRPAAGEKPLECFVGKVAALVSASPGYYGGYRGLQQVRYVLGNIGCIALPDMFALPRAHEAFTETGDLKDPKQAEMAGNLGRSLVAFANRTAG